MKYIFSVIATFAVVGCSVGPIHLTHTEGELPRWHVDTWYSNCKLKPKVDILDLDDYEIYYVCKWEY